MDPKNEFDPEVIRKIETLKNAPERNPQKAAESRSAFMLAAQKELEGVSPLPVKRHNSWMSSIGSKISIQRKEHSQMFNFITTILITLSLLLGGGGVTVAAAQSSQPDQALYGVKLLSEDVRLQMAGNPETQFQLAMEFASRRAAEIQTMLQAGNVPDEAVQTRYQYELEQAMQFALELPNGQAIQALQQIQARLQTQDQAMNQVQQNNASPKAEAALIRNREMIQEHLQWVINGLSDPTQLKNQLRQEMRNPASSKNSTDLSIQSTDGTGQGNPWTEGTPTPLSGYGPGESQNPWTDVTPTPLSGYGPGESQNPWTTGTPTPYSGYGPGPGDGGNH